MSRVILTLIVVGVMIYAVIDCLRTNDEDIRALPKPLWLLAIIALPLVGALMWIWLGIERDQSGPGGRPQRRVVAPDDDPDFLRSLDPPRNPQKPPPGGTEPA